MGKMGKTALFSSIFLFAIFLAGSFAPSSAMSAGKSQAAGAGGDAAEPVQHQAKAAMAVASVDTKEGVGPVKKYYPEGSPTRAIQDLDDMLDDFKVAGQGEKLTAAEQAQNDQLKQKIIRGTFDIRELAKQSLVSHWNGLSEGQRSQFVGLLTDLLEQKALFSKEQSAAKGKSGGKYFVVYRGHKLEGPSGTLSFVRTKVVVPSENIDISLNYRLKKQGSEWKIYDVIVDEASLVDNYKYQFDSIIKKHGFGDLIRRMSEKLAEIRSKRNS